MGRLAVKPLQYGNIIKFYENADRTPAQLAAVFRTTIIGFENCTEADVEQMPPGIPTLLETVVLLASGALESEQEQEVERDKPRPDEVDAPENSIWASHNKTKNQKAKENATISDADTQYILHDNNETFESIYKMLLPEIRMLIEGINRARERQEQQQDTSSGSVGSGNKGDRAAAMGWR